MCFSHETKQYNKKSTLSSGIVHNNKKKKIHNLLRMWQLNDIDERKKSELSKNIT